MGFETLDHELVAQRHNFHSDLTFIEARSLGVPKPVAGLRPIATLRGDHGLPYFFIPFRQPARLRAQRCGVTFGGNRGWREPRRLR